MGFADSAVGLLFKISATSDFSKQQAEVDKFTQSLTTQFTGSSKAASAAMDILTSAISKTGETSTKLEGQLKNTFSSFEKLFAKEFAGKSNNLSEMFKINPQEAGNAKAVFEDFVTKFRSLEGAGTQTSAAIKLFGNDAAKVTEELNGLGSAGETAASGIGAAINPITLAVAAVAAMAVAAAATGKELFEIAEKASQYGVKIYDASVKTGLSSEKISALAFLAKESGTSIEALTTSIDFFEKKLTTAGESSKKSAYLFTKVGLDPQTAYKDLNKSFETVISKLQGMSDGAAKTGLAMEIFGKGGAKSVLTVLDAMHGKSLPEVIAKLKELGVILSDQDTKLADDFRKSLELIDTQAQTLAFHFASGYMPEMIKAMNGLSQAIGNNQDTAKTWGVEVGNTLLGLEKGFEFFVNHVESTLGGLGLKLLDTQAKFGVLLTVAAPLLGIANGIGNLVSDAPASVDAKVQLPEKITPKGDNSAEKAREKELGAQIKGTDLDVDIAKAGYDKDKKNLEDSLKANAISLDVYRDRMYKAITDTQGKIDAFYTHQGELVNQRFKGTQLENAIKELAEKRIKTESEFDSDAEKATIDVREKKIKSKEIEVQESLKIAKAGNDKELADFEILYNQKKKSEIEYLQFKNDQEVKFLELERQKTREADAYLAVLLQQEAVSRSATPEESEAFLKQNPDHIKNQNREAELNKEIEAKRTEGIAATAKIEYDIQKQYEVEQRELDNESTEIYFENDQKRLEHSIQTNERVTANAKELLELQKKYIYGSDVENEDGTLRHINGTLDNTIKQLEVERDRRLLNVQGAKNQAVQEENINSLFQQRIDLAKYEADQRAKENQDRYDNTIGQNASSKYGGGQFGSLMGDMAQISDPMVSAAKKQEIAINSLGGAYDLLKQTAGGALDSMIGQSQDLLTQWILTGKLSGKAILGLAASVVSGLAIQAGIKAIFEVAEGYASAASFPFNPLGLQQSAMHFAAAATYGTVAGAAGVAAVGLRLAVGNSLNTDSGSKTSGSLSSTNSNSSNSLSSSNDPKVIEESRLQSQETQMNEIRDALKKQTIQVDIKHESTLKADGDYVVNAWINDVRNLGSTRDVAIQLIRDET